MKKLAALVLVSLLAGYGLHALAQARVDVRQALTPIGTSSSNGVSFVWFYESTERAVYVCRTGQSVADAVDCRSKTTLP